MATPSRPRQYNGPHGQVGAMLPQPVADTARRAVAIAMQDRRATFQQAVAEVITEMNRRGVLMSGMTVQRVRDLVVTEYEVRAHAGSRPPAFPVRARSARCLPVLSSATTSNPSLPS